MPGAGKRAYHAAILIILVLTSAFMVWMSWLKWPDLIVDFGREIYVPWRLSEGETLYLDIAYFNGPLSPYLNALVFKAFGASVLAMAFANIFLTGVIAYVIYKILDTGDGFLVPFLGAFMFLSMFAFAKYFPMGSYNFIAPYSHELIHGTLASFLSIYMVKRYLRSSRLVLLGAAGLFAGLAMLTKVEVALSALISLTFSFILITAVERPVKERLKKMVFWAIAGVITPVVVSIALIGLSAGMGPAIKGVFGSWSILATTGIASSSFYTRMMGLDKAGENISLALRYGLGWVAALGLPAAATYLLRRNQGARRYGPFISFAVVAFVAIYVLDSVSWLLILRPLPLLVGLSLAVLSIGLVKGGADRDRLVRTVPVLALSAFAIIMLLKIILNAQINGYGFVLALPGALVALYMAASWLPRKMDERWGASSIYLASFLAVFIVVVFWHIKEERRYYQPMTYPVAKGADTILTYDPKVVGVGYATNVLLENIEKIMAPEEGFVVMPEGALVNFLARRPSPAGYINFVPADVQMFGEGKMLKALESSRPSYIIMISRDTSEYGPAYLGQGYGNKLFSFVTAHYEPLLQIGSSDFLEESRGFSQPIGMIVMRRASTE